MAKKKLGLTEKFDTLAGLVLIAMCLAPVIWCAQTGTSFDYIVSLALGVVVWFLFLVIGGSLLIAIVGGILGGGGK
ncbi:MAG: hypothetical protein IK051_02165 [Rhodocyclaceae bacterium]|nr:hypothetical protein [Rhodocyclaceae bacterium]MBR4736452.1 hypothetical protein [Rhodocyclaceae bacterium]